MKYATHRGWLPVTAAILSLAGFALRTGLYAVAVDVKGLLIPSHPLELALWAVTAIGAAAILAPLRKLGGPGDYSSNFGPSAAAGIGHILLGCCILATVLTRELPGTLGMVWKALGFLAAPALVWGGICRRQGKKPFFLIHGAACIFLLLQMVGQYPVWSGNPQLQDYVFELLAAVAMTLFLYHCAAFEAGTGSRRMHLAAGLLTVLLSGPALSGTGFSALYLGSAIFTATNLCALTPQEKGREADDEPC